MARITKAIFGNEYSVLTVSAYLQGEYGESGIYIGIPCVVNRMGIQRIVELPLGGEEKQRLHSSCEMLGNLTIKKQKNMIYYETVMMYYVNV